MLTVGEPFLTQETVDPPPISLPGGIIDRTGEGNTILRGSGRETGHGEYGYGVVDGTSLYSRRMGSTWVSLAVRRRSSSQRYIRKAVFLFFVDDTKFCCVLQTHVTMWGPSLFPSQVQP